ncbi:hypothetical protein [Lentzea cavernae]|uniref:Uncharacterized protein n=1 Tax=Lentzea cavernae TaxID=2020703 RepID=A0ABQ3MLH8_9PSEU|nr:hypothetical protein [Lentzea cavernae]GHH46753.1 hypothetical protein GCM10017774_50160 [Lentzea cavernae]
MREFDEPSRTSGPGVVADGPAGAPTVLVIDPAGEAPHNEIPATWRNLTDRLRIVWLRVPAAPTWQSTVDKVLTMHRDDVKPVLDVVTSGPIAADVLDLVRRHEDLVRSVLLVDPEVEVHDEFARVVVRSSDSPDDRIPPPLPLGHPDVVFGVVEELDRLG